MAFHYKTSKYKTKVKSEDIYHIGRLVLVLLWTRQTTTTKWKRLLTTDRPTNYLNETPTPALQRKLNNKLLTLKKTDNINFRRYNRLRCSVPQPPKLYGLPKLHKPNIPMRPIVSFCGSPTYQLSKYLINVLTPLTDESRHKLQSTENFIDAIKTIQIPDDHKLYVSFDVKSLFASIPLDLALDSVLRTLLRTLLLKYHYLQTTLWTYSTSV